VALFEGKARKLWFVLSRKVNEVLSGAEWSQVLWSEGRGIQNEGRWLIANQRWGCKTQ
jgi:hypothetical protein